MTFIAAPGPGSDVLSGDDPHAFRASGFGGGVFGDMDFAEEKQLRRRPSRRLAGSSSGPASS